MQAQGQLITLRDGMAKVLIAPDLGGWLLRYSRHLPDLGFVDALHYSKAVVDRYPNQIYAGNPLLFPQVSFNHLPGREHHYEWQGEVFAMPQHGFARRSRWKVTGVNGARLLMELAATDETRAQYPFSFRCTVAYELVDGRLHFRQTVENRGEKPMPFSTGIHPYFTVPIIPGSNRAACYLEIPAGRRVMPDPLWQSWTTEPFPAQEWSVQKDVSGTLFLTNLDTPEIALVDPEARVKIRLNFSDAHAHRFVALWSRSNSDPFYCVEPWTALPNSMAQATELIILAPGERFEAEMWLDLERI